MRLPRSPWLLPPLTLALGAAVFVSAQVELGGVLANVRRSFEVHAQSVTSLTRDCAQQAATALELAYSLAEEELERSADLMVHEEGDGVPRPEARDIRVFVSGATPETLQGTWGPVGPAERAPFVREVLAAEPDNLAEGPMVRRLGVYCAHYRMGGRTQIACRDLTELSRLRRETGLGRLLRDVTGRGILYVALQDENGVVARTPGRELSTWSDDEFLATARAPATTVFRRVTWHGTPLVEGVTTFPLPDGTSPVLRVGVDATSLAEVERAVAARQRTHAVLVLLLILAAIGMAAVLSSRQRQSALAAQAIREREEEKRHWQTIGQMAATVAHEVRAPLSTIKMATQRLGREFSVPECDRAEFGELTAVLGSEADRLERVVGDFLELGRPLQLSLEPIDSAAAVDEAVMPVRLRAEQAGQELVVEHRTTAEISVDRRRFGQVVINLVANALDAAPAGGTVHVTSRCDATGFHLLVRDNGPGMDAETLARVQQPFVSTKAHGTGLGLPLVRRLCEALGGRLILTSEAGVGTEAHVELPATVQGAPP